MSRTLPAKFPTSSAKRLTAPSKSKYNVGVKPHVEVGA